MAAVPVPKASLILLFFIPSMTSSISIFLSSSFIFQSFEIRITESLVIPGRIEPESSGVTSVSPFRKKILLVPTSSTYFLSFASSHKTWLQPSFFASSAARRLAA